MSETVKSFIGRVAVVEQEGSAVRVLLNEGETMYAARDLLAACGCAYPTKWCQREAKSESDVKLVKLPFPVNGKTGGASRRSVPMYFVTERCGRMILDIFGCSKETRAWIEGKVFACKLGKPDEQTPTELPAPTQVAVPEKPTPPPTGELSVRINGNESAALRFFPSEEAIIDGLRKNGVEAAYDDFADTHPHTHGSETDTLQTVSGDF